MAIIKKEKYLKDIASRLGNRALYFEKGDRPTVQMGGRQVYVSSVAYDREMGEMTFTVRNDRDELLQSEHGPRPLSQLDINTLSKVGESVRKYAALRLERERNLINVESRLRAVGKGVSLGL